MGLRGLFAVALVVLLSAPSGFTAAAQSYDQAFEAQELNLEEECTRLYKFREADIRYPIAPKGNENYCRISTGGEQYDVSKTQYYGFLHRSLRFVCKGKRPILLDFAASISGCNGEKRQMQITKQDDKCFIEVEETGERYLIPKKNIRELKAYMEDMSLMELMSMQLASGLVFHAMQETAKCES